MAVYLILKRKKLTIFTDAKQDTSVLELKRVIQGMIKISPADQQLYNIDRQIMEDDKLLQDYGITPDVAKPKSPAIIGLTIRQDNGEFETLDMAPYSSPPDLPDDKKSQETLPQKPAV